MPDTKDTNSNLIMGRHPVQEALAHGRQIEKILALKNGTGSVKQILARAGERGIRIRYVERSELDRLAGGVRHQGVIAYAVPYRYSSVEDMLKLAAHRGEDPFLILLDNIEDPHNLGAVMRSAECAGAHGVVISRDRSCGLNETAARTSAGAVEYLPCARVTNMSRTIESLKKAGLWIAASDMDGDLYTAANLRGPLALVIGSEGRGISRLVKEKCDFTVSIPMRGRIESLNASNAAAVLMYEVRRQRDAE
ncbi:MAG: 23S rRNA (guanosine(2251)-2'-O)-methyltransferase RlmB [Eubacteriales bacterium]|nr:23S rRNA (guanosine(2251)-2'-O)-methyltransferase RlmB [Eubacteriales bacterium]